MKIGVNYLTEAKNNKKKTLAHGKGMGKMLRICNEKGLTKDNSELIVRNDKDLNSEWWVVEK